MLGNQAQVITQLIHANTDILAQEITAVIGDASININQRIIGG
jgi:hypothetical protein